MNDDKLIESLGGPTAVANLLGYKKGGAQRVHNWIERGIPAKVKLQFPELFLPQFIDVSTAIKSRKARK